MKVLITTDWYKPVINGVVTSVVSLAEGLTALGHEVRILTLSGNRNSRTEGNVTYIASIGVGKIYPNARLKATRASKHVKALIDWCPDIVHSQCEFSTFFLAKRIAETCSCPLVHTYHTVYEDFTHYFSPSVRFGKFMAAKFSRTILAKTQTVVAPTKKTEDLLRGYGVETLIATIPTGLQLEQFSAPIAAADILQARAAWGLAATDKVLIYLGRLAQEKNVEELLRLVAKRQDSNLRLLLVGDGPYAPVLKEMVKSLDLSDKVIFTGMVPPKEVAKYYRLGDIFVSASQSETQGLTYIEAMAAGLPLLCRADACLEDVVHNGSNGYTYNNAAEFNSILDELIARPDLCTALGGAAAKTVTEAYSDLAFAGKMLGVYERLLQAAAAKSDESNDLAIA